MTGKQHDRGCSGEAGYTLVELLVVISILLVVLSAVVVTFVSATNAEVDQTARAATQQDARTALDQMRRDIHCASFAYRSVGSDKLTLNENQNPCPIVTSTGWVTWCTTQVTTPDGSLRYALRRSIGANAATPPSGPCDANALRRADYLTSAAAWPTLTCVAGSGRFPTVSVDLRINEAPIKHPGRSYRLTDSIALRNAAPC